MEAEILKFGFMGVVVLGLCYYVLKKDKDHEKKEQEWRQTMEKIAEKLDKRQDDTNKTLRENTSILSGLTKLLENKK